MKAQTKLLYKKKYTNIIYLTHLTLVRFFGATCIDFLQSPDHQLMSILLPLQFHLDK